ncbi:MAG TPA: nucleotidyl transferase AbiEii/AbiGii toxin family protein [Candidatus Wunengus sp. YC63]|uniref:nucleotidyl transferase AbiEii/AbiGii toxin family protein n=1 Tax=unclassified Candidatus Wunengus TaxID=3367695 RepID=UPI004025B0FC
MINELEVLKIVVKRLESAGVPYMITGSIAANFYTTPRMTRDIDIVIEIGENNIEVLFSLFSDDFYIDKDSIRTAICNKQIFNIIHKEGVVKIDFIIRKDKKYSKIEFSRKRSIVFEELKINVTSPEDLILSKLFWAKDTLSEMQIRDVRNLMKTVPDLDIKYIENWIKELELESIYRKVAQ